MAAPQEHTILVVSTQHSVQWLTIVLASGQWTEEEWRGRERRRKGVVTRRRGERREEGNGEREGKREKRREEQRGVEEGEERGEEEGAERGVEEREEQGDKN